MCSTSKVGGAVGGGSVGDGRTEVGGGESPITTPRVAVPCGTVTSDVIERKRGKARPAHNTRTTIKPKTARNRDIVHLLKASPSQFHTYLS
jgi:hypothetical protein